MLGQLHLACLQGPIGFGANRESFFPRRDLDLSPQRLALAQGGRTNALDLEGARTSQLLDARAGLEREP